MAKIKGIYIPHCKNTANYVPEPIATPSEVLLPMSMHSGTPATPIVAVGDEVKIGQLIGKATGRVSSPVHASVSGKINRIKEFDPITGEKAGSIVITADAEQMVCKNITPPTVTNTTEFLDAVQNSGVVGLGGAGYPTAPKLTLKEGTNLDFILINGAECEPYITSDTRIMVDDAESVFEGSLLMQKYLNPKQVIICIEDNKPKAIRKLQKLAANVDGLSIHILPSTYPQGERKVLVYNVTGRIVPEGSRLTDVGCIVINCTTVAVFAKYIKTGMPLTHRIVTVDGSAVKYPKNVVAPIGTPIKLLFDHCGGLTDDVEKIIMGGPMMGKAVPNSSAVLTKCVNAILALTAKDSKPPVVSACIKCGRCIEVCPMNLMPSHIEDAFEQKNISNFDNFKVHMCAECGCCAYICPSKRPLAQVMYLSKNMQWEANRK